MSLNGLDGLAQFGAGCIQLDVQLFGLLGQPALELGIGAGKLGLQRGQLRVESGQFGLYRTELMRDLLNLLPLVRQLAAQPFLAGAQFLQQEPAADGQPDHAEQDEISHPGHAARLAGRWRLGGFTLALACLRGGGGRFRGFGRGLGGSGRLRVLCRVSQGCIPIMFGFRHGDRQGRRCIGFRGVSRVSQDWVERGR